MLAAQPLAVNVLDPHSLLSSFGVFGIFVVLVAETGLLIGIFLPGDSLLFTAGLLCTTSATNRLHLSLPAVLLAAVAGALVGAQLGFLLGRAAGPNLTSPNRSARLRAAVNRGREGLQRYGPPKAIVLARFIPVVRTVMNPLAGAIGIEAKTFAIWQVVGGVGWSAGVTLAGYALGSRIPSIDKYLLPIIALIVVISLIPVVLEVRRTRARAVRHDA
jgi:membrane-associated protein